MKNPVFKRFSVTPLSPALGATVDGLDLSLPFDPDLMSELKAAFSHYLVLFFADQQLSCEQFLDFAHVWGEVAESPYFTPVEGFPDIVSILKEPEHQRNIGSSWHTDHSFDACPPRASLLQAIELPTLGGDTLLTNMQRVYQSLSPGLQASLWQLNAVHCNRTLIEASQDQAFAGRIRAGGEGVTNVHPLVIRHPGTGLPSLFLNRYSIIRFENWTEEESAPLLDFLMQQATRPEFTCRYQWQPGTVAIWDNRATMHCALNDYPGERRLMHRIIVAGEAIEPYLDLITTHPTPSGRRPLISEYPGACRT